MNNPLSGFAPDTPNMEENWIQSLDPWTRAGPPPGNIFQAILNLRLLLGIIAKARNEVGLNNLI